MHFMYVYTYTRIYVTFLYFNVRVDGTNRDREYNREPTAVETRKLARVISTDQQRPDRAPATVVFVRRLGTGPGTMVARFPPEIPMRARACTLCVRTRKRRDKPEGFASSPTPVNDPITWSLSCTYTVSGGYALRTPVRERERVMTTVGDVPPRPFHCPRYHWSSSSSGHRSRDCTPNQASVLIAFHERSNKTLGFKRTEFRVKKHRRLIRSRRSYSRFRTKTRISAPINR